MQNNSNWQDAANELKNLAALCGRTINTNGNAVSINCGRVSFHIEKPDTFNHNQPGAICAEKSNGQAVELLCDCQYVLTLARHYLAGILNANGIAAVIQYGE